jgi:hypothetical protein
VAGSSCRRRGSQASMPPTTTGSTRSAATIALWQDSS